jgi:hypothetical protein
MEFTTLPVYLYFFYRYKKTPEPPVAQDRLEKKWAD